MNSRAVLMRRLVILWIVSLVFLVGCRGSTNSPPPPPAPSISSISPSSVAAGAVGFTLTVNGANFASDAVVRWNGSSRPTVFVSSSQVTAQISGSDIAAAGTAAITVFSPAPGGGMSNTVNFAITIGDNPIPTIIGLSPTATAVGGPAFTLTVGGSNFVSSSVVRWNGSDRPTAFVSSSQVTAQISAGDIAATGTAAITVFSPAPGGGSSKSLTFSIVTGVGPLSVAVAPDPSGRFGKFAYVANSTSNNVSMYTINPTTGTLEAVGTIAAGTGPVSVAVDPSGKFAYVANEGSNSISMYTIDATTGALTSTGMVAAATNPSSVTVDPSGKFAYVANHGSNNVSMYTINATTGGLTSTGTVVAATNPSSVTVDPSGKFAYVANWGSNNVSMYTISATTGALTSTGTIAAGTSPVSVAVDPSGKFAYAANCGDLSTVFSDVSMYTINATTGTLTSIGRTGAGTCPWSVAVDPSGKFAYVANSGGLGFDVEGVSMYTINASTGTLTSIGIIDAGLFPTSVAIDPSGKFAYVANEGSNSISMYTINATTGVLTLIGTIGT